MEIKEEKGIEVAEKGIPKVKIYNDADDKNVAATLIFENGSKYYYDSSSLYEVPSKDYKELYTKGVVIKAANGALSTPTGLDENGAFIFGGGGGSGANWKAKEGENGFIANKPYEPIYISHYSQSDPIYETTIDQSDYDDRDSVVLPDSTALTNLYLQTEDKASIPFIIQLPGEFNIACTLKDYYYYAEDYESWGTNSLGSLVYDRVENRWLYQNYNHLDGDFSISLVSQTDELAEPKYSQIPYSYEVTGFDHTYSLSDYNEDHIAWSFEDMSYLGKLSHMGYKGLIHDINVKMGDEVLLFEYESGGYSGPSFVYEDAGRSYGFILQDPYDKIDTVGFHAEPEFEGRVVVLGNETARLTNELSNIEVIPCHEIRVSGNRERSALPDDFDLEKVREKIKQNIPVLFVWDDHMEGVNYSGGTYIYHTGTFCSYGRIAPALLTYPDRFGTTIQIHNEKTYYDSNARKYYTSYHVYELARVTEYDTTYLAFVLISNRKEEVNWKDGYSYWYE